MLTVPRVAVVGLVLLGAVLPAAAEAQTPAVVSPEVVHTGTAPIGYEVTFRIHDPSALRMRIKGEWSFSAASDSSASPPLSAGRLPSQWRPGDFPIAFPNATAANWPVADMVKDAATGVWSYTTPLPSGTFTYQLFKDCDAAPPALSGCVPSSDPANPPWNTRGSIERTSQVYVPSDPAFGTIDYSWQAPVPAAQRGTQEVVTYPSPLSTNPVGTHDLALYLPPGYDPNRAKPYPLLVISHGGGGHEIDWSTQGVSSRIVDNLIASGQMQPAVVAATNYNGLAGVTGYAADVRTAVIPFLVQNYNVAEDASGWAFSGLSAGGARANELLFNNTTAFGYYGVWAAAGTVPAAGDPVWSKPEFKQLLGLHIGVGNQDPIIANTLNEQARFRAAGVPFVENNVDGGHEWYVWRINLRDYLTKVAFRATKTSVVAGAGTLNVTVSPATAQPAVPTGTVQAFSGGTPLGAPVALVNGTATLPIPSTSGSVTVAYSGDTLYNAGTSPIAGYSSGTVGGTVPATLSLSLGSQPSFGAFTPGMARDYFATATAIVTSSAGDAALIVQDPSPFFTNRLVNGSFALAQELQVRNQAGAFQTLPAGVRFWGGPVAGESVPLEFKQSIGAGEPLRTGSYSKTLTFTLSTTTP